MADPDLAALITNVSRALSFAQTNRQRAAIALLVEVSALVQDDVLAREVVATAMHAEASDLVRAARRVVH
jgi:hypothetical protein